MALLLDLSTDQKYATAIWVPLLSQVTDLLSNLCSKSDVKTNVKILCAKKCLSLTIYAELQNVTDMADISV